MSNDQLIQGKYVLGKSSVVGDARRKWEDRVYAGEIKREHGDPLIIGIVADGIGSADIGSRGAQLAVDTVLDEFSKSVGNDIPDIIERAMQAANQVVYAENQKNEKEGWTTLVIAVVYGNRCFIGNVGDSRAYWAQENGTLLQLTRDHTFYNIHGGDPNAENAAAVVNTIGVKKETQVDPGFYLKPDMTKEQAHRIGYAGLPLKSGEAIVLCSDGLIKTDHANNRYAKDEEIVNALQTEYEQDKAAIKMVGVAEGRRPTDNVSAVTIQYLSDELIKQRQSRSAQAARTRILVRTAGVLIVLGMVAAITFLGLQLKNVLEAPLPTAVEITSTPAPTLAPTSTIVPGQARVDKVYGSGGNVKLDQYLDPGAIIFASSEGVKVVVGQQSNITGVNNTAGVMYWFGAANEKWFSFSPSTGKVNFDANHMMPVLEGGALYIQPSNSKAEIHFAQQPNFIASVEGSQMIVELTGNDIWVYCFQGKCLLDTGGDTVLKIEVGSKRLYHTVLAKADNSMPMSDDEKWAWNVKCNFCIEGLSTPTPTPTPIINDTSAGQATPKHRK